MEHEVSGRVVVLETRVPVGGVTVDIWRKSPLMDAHVASLETGPDGSFVTRVEAGLFARLKTPQVYVRVWASEEHELYNGAESLRALKRPREDIEVGIPLREFASEHTVQLMVELQPRVVGTLRYVDVNGRDVPAWSERHKAVILGLTVELWDVDRDVRLAAEAATIGDYLLWFSTAEFRAVRNVQVRVVSRSGPPAYEGPVLQWYRETLEHPITVLQQE
ncbi:MAG: hypothetical protein ACI8PZ_001407 [Myxococcota bacterium]|jgi:hypothetical protein